MKILGRTKDYYDYLVGELGIDEHVILDRTNFCVLNGDTDTICTNFKKVMFSDEPITSYSPNINDKPKEMHSVFTKGHLVKELKGKIYYLILEVGDTHYVFTVERSLSDDGTLCKEIKMVKKEPCGRRIGGHNIITMAWIPEMYSLRGVDGINVGELIIMGRAKDMFNGKIPILKDTFIPAFIPANEIYNTLYNYLLKMKEPVVVDTRTDVEKLESKGFDKKDSFRPKHRSW